MSFGLSAFDGLSWCFFLQVRLNAPEYLWSSVKEPAFLTYNVKGPEFFTI